MVRPAPTLPDTPAAGQIPVPPTLPDATRGPGKKPARGKKGLVALLVVVGMLVVLGGAAVLLREPLMRYFIQREAAKNGVVVDFELLGWKDETIELGKVKASLRGVKGLSISISRAKLGMDGLALRSIEAKSAVVNAVGSAADLTLSLGAWSSEYPSLYRVAGSATEVRVIWAEKRGASPWLSIEGGKLSSTGSGATFSAASASAMGLPIGAVGAVWTADPKSITVGVGTTDIAAAKLRVVVRPEDSPPNAEVTLQPTRLAELSSPMGISLPANTSIRGGAKLSFGKDAFKDPIVGAMTMVVDGWIPPHPKELDGIVFGSSTSFASNFEVSEDRTRVALSESSVMAGSFALKGNGTIERGEGWALSKMDMKGQIPCSALAKSAISANVGGPLGQLIGGVAQGAMKGNVDVTVHLEADTRNLAAAKVDQKVGVGCALGI